MSSEPLRSAELIKFGDFELDLRAYELRRGGRSLKLEPIPMGLLVLLVERRGELVLRDQIIERLWGKDVFFDTDNSINSAVRKLRQALRDDPDRAKFILTVTGKGYRFVAPIDEIVPALAPNAALKQAPTSSDAIFPGRKISHYRIIQLLGGGGMGVVYKAEDLKLGRAVALKFLPAELASDRVAFERLQREARAASALDHPNICSIYQLDEHEGQPFIVMQFLEGQTLREWIESALAKPPEERLANVIELAIQIADGLEAAHQKGIIHRDIKPANIIITTRGQAKILDFGVAKFIDSIDAGEAREAAPEAVAEAPNNGDLHLTRTGASLGTPSYLSPEQIRHEKIDARTDLFSFGLVLHEMATGHRAFAGDTETAIREAVLHASAERVRHLSPELPEGLEQIISKSLEKDREARYQSAKEMRGALAGLSDSIRLHSLHVNKAIPGPSPESVAPQTTLQLRRSRSFLWWGPLLVVLIGLGVAALWWSRRPEPAFRPLRQRRLTANSATDPVFSAAISRDDKYLGYTDRAGLHLQLVSTGETHNLEPQTGIQSEQPVWIIGDWFPDSTRFTATLVTPGKPASLWSIPILGSPTLLMEDVIESSKVSPDGSLVAFFREEGANGPREIWLMGSRGESAHRVVSTHGREGFSKLAWDPRGSRIAYTKNDYSSEEVTVSIESCDLNGNSHTSILSVPNLVDFAWIAPDRLIYSRLGAGESDNLWEARLRNGVAESPARQLTDWAGSEVHEMSASNTRTLAFLREASNQLVVIGDLGLGSLQNPRILTDDEYSDIPLAWTPDSREVIFSSVRGRSRQIYRQKLDGSSAPQQITFSGDESFFLARIAPDATSLIVEGGWGKSRKIGLYRVREEGGVPELLFETGGMVSYGCTAQPLDFCVYAPMVPDQTQISIKAFNPATGNQKDFMRIPVEAGVDYHWALAPDGTAIAIVKDEWKGCELRLLKVGNDKVRSIMLNGVVNCSSLDWAGDSKSMFIGGSRAAVPTLLRVWTDGRVQPIWAQPHASTTWGVPSPDGRHLGIRSDSTNANVWIIDNY